MKKIINIKNTSPTLAERLKQILLVFVLVVSVCVFSEKVYSAAVCITNPWGKNGEDQRCSINVSVSVSPSSVVSGSSATISYSASTLYQWGDNGIEDGTVTVTNASTGASSDVAQFSGPPVGTWSGSVGTGALSNSSTITLWAMTGQLVTGSDSTFVSVTPAPTVNVSFSFLDTLKKVKSYLFETASAASL